MKKTYQTARQSTKALLRNKGRSFLTILGIIIGIASVIALVSLGNGVKASISGQIKTLGTTNLTITPGQGFGSSGSSSSSSSSQKSSGGLGGRNSNGGQSFGQSASTLTVTDLTTLSDRAKHPLIKAASGDVVSSSIFSVNGVDERLGTNGVSPSYFAIFSLALGHGRLLSSADVASASRVAVVGSQFASDVLGSTTPVGRTIEVAGQPYRVVGVLANVAESSFTNPNIQVYLPYSAAMADFGVANFNTITVQATDQSSVDAAKSDIERTLLANHKISDQQLADFSVNSSKDLLSTVNSITSVLTSLLAGIAAISLLVGGIGIMNIMLVSVTERTREIGLRKAVGAKTRDILVQFIIETLILTLVGGLLGIGLGKLIGVVAAHALGIKPITTMSSVVLAVGVSAGVGLIFGIYPAAKAARLNPIEALRYE